MNRKGQTAFDNNSQRMQKSNSFRTPSTGVKYANQVPDENTYQDKIDQMVKNATSYDDELQSFTSNTSLHQARSDLMQLGIDLDDELIDRLQKNLGIDKIFKVAHDAVHVLKSTTKSNVMNPDELSNPFDVYGQPLDHPTEFSYRHNAHTPTTTPKRINTTKHTKRKQDISSIFTLHQKSTIHLLKQLENRDDCIEPQYRPLIDQLLEYLRLLYIRSPKKFLYRLLNKKLLSSEEKKILFTKGKSSLSRPASSHTTTSGHSITNETATTTGTAATTTTIPGGVMGSSYLPDEEIQLMYKWILQSRYFNYIEFEEMLIRILPQPHHYTPEVFKAFFLLICDEKRFESSQKKKVVDLWNFLTLLKLSSEESRRSYDHQKSKLANDVEFWRRDNNIKFLKQSIMVDQQQRRQQQQQQQQVEGNDPLDPNPSSTTQRNSWMTTSAIEAAKPNNQVNNKKFHRKKNDITTDPVPVVTRSADGAIASILGQQRYESKGQKYQGRSVFGTFKQETMNTCDVPASLNAESHHRPNDPQYFVADREAKMSSTKTTTSPVRSHRSFQLQHDLPIHPANDDVFDSSKVSYLLGNEKKRKEIEQKFAPSSSTTSLSAAVENSYSLYHSPRKTKSIGCYDREVMNTTTVAGALGKSPDYSNGGGNMKTLKQYQERVAKTDYRLRMNSVSNLHWDQTTPSVASALKPSEVFPKRVHVVGTDI